MLTLEGHKGVSLTLMLIITLFTSFSPLYIRKVFLKRVRSDLAEIGLSGCLCFGSGILMATIFLHILPEAVETVEGAMDKGLMREIHYPVTQISLCMGFFLVYFVEELVRVCISKKIGHHKEHQDMSKIKQSSDKCGNTNRVFICEEGEHEFERKGSQSHGYATSAPQIHGHLEAHEFLKNVSMITSLIMIIALSFHSFMEGMALGLEEDTQGVWLMFVALSSHKIFISLSMSMELLEIAVPRKVFVSCMMIFSFSSPIGVLVGAIITAYSPEIETAASVLTPAILQALSGGTILYVVFCEILERERAKDSGGMLKIFCLLAGFAVMAALQAIEHDHEPEHGEESTVTLATTSIGSNFTSLSSNISASTWVILDNET